MKLRTSIIRVLIVAAIVALCFVFGSCSSPSGNKAKMTIIQSTLFQYTMTDLSGVEIKIYVYAVDKYDAERLLDKKMGTNYRSASIKEIVPLNKYFVVYK